MNLKDYDSARVCEALAWLYGGELQQHFQNTFWHTARREYVVFRESDGKWLLSHDRWDEDITAQVAHALEVTAPWEWDGRYARIQSSGVESCYFRACPDNINPEENTRYHWMLSFCGGPNMDGWEANEDSAKAAARAAYLTWMRGRLAMKGLPEAPTPCTDCEGTGWSYHEHLPVERHIGCESCGGCGNERGTGITP